jgi:hypothetical protein
MGRLNIEIFEIQAGSGVLMQLDKKHPADRIRKIHIRKLFIL